MHPWEIDEYIDRFIERYPLIRNNFVAFRNNPKKGIYLGIKFHQKDLPLVILLLELALVLAKVKKKTPYRMINTLLLRGVELALKTYIPIMRKQGIKVDISEDIFWEEYQKDRLRELNKNIKKNTILDILTRRKDL